VPSHVPRTLAPVKQQETLAKYEARLLHALKHGSRAEAIHSAAERVRRCQLSILKARRELIRYAPLTEQLSLELEGIDAAASRWLALSSQDIVQQYSGSAPNNRWRGP